MKATYTAQTGRLSFELEAPTAKELFSEIASVQEVFDAESCCGLCGSADIRFVVREAEGKGKKAGQMFTYYELRCQGVTESDGQPCRGRFDFGQSLDTKNLFPKRKADEGEPEKGPRGWYRYVNQNFAAPAARYGASTEADEQGAAKRSPVPPPAPGAGTDPASRDRYARLARAWGWTGAIPMDFAALVQMARDHFAALTAPSTEGAQEFDKNFRRYMFEHKTDSLDPNNIKAFMTELFEVEQTLRKAEVPY